MVSTNQKNPIINLYQSVHNLAKQFASEQSSREKFKQVYLNTLAVQAVNRFLEWFEVETDLSAGDSWNSVLRRFNDVADLVIPELGIVECRPVFSEDTVIVLPPEVTEERLAYVGVRFQEQLNQVELIGFYPASDLVGETIPISQLKPMEELIDYLFELEGIVIDNELVVSSPEEVSGLIEGLTAIEKMRVDLSRWFEDIFETGWQALESFLSLQEESIAFRFAVDTRARSFESEGVVTDEKRGIKLLEGFPQPLALVKKIQKETDETRDILLQLYPLGQEVYLPQGVEMIVLDDDDDVFLEAKARESDNWIQLQFRGQPQESYRVKIVLDEVSVIEEFLI
ncbi:MAG: DUF1822 family protein [Halothece sp.]